MQLGGEASNVGSVAARGWLVAALAFTTLVYFPITRNYFFRDDFLNLYRIANGPALQYLVTPHGGHLLVLRNAIFWLTFQVFGPNAPVYYWTAFATHLVNVYLLFRLLRLLGIEASIASLGAAVWGTAAFSEGTLGWYSAFGQVMVATIALIILGHMQSLVAQGRTPDARTEWLWSGLAWLGAMCFGTGIVFAMSLPFILVLMFPGHYSWRRRPLLILLIAVPLTYYGANAVYTHMTGVPVTTTSPTTMIANLIGITILALGLAFIGISSLILGYVFPALASMTGLSYAIGLGFALAVLLLSRKWPSQIRRWLATCAMLVCGCYGLIVAARLFMMRWSLLGGSEYARWHYFTQMLLTVIICIVLARATARLGVRRTHVLVALWYCVAIAAYLRIGPRVDNHDGSRQLTEQALRRISAAIKAAPQNQPVVIANGGFPAVMLPGRPFFPGLAAAFVIFYPDNYTQDGRRVYFQENDAEVVRATSSGNRTSTLFAR